MIGPKIKALRLEKGLSQQTLAELLSTSSGYISELEKGKKKPGLDHLISLKRVFEVDMNWLLIDEGEIKAIRPVIIADPAPLFIAEMSQERKKKVKLGNMLNRIIDEGDHKKIKAVESQLDLLDPGEKKPNGTHEDDGGGGYMGGLVA